MGHLAVAVDHLVLRESGTAPGTPGHRAVALVEPTLLLAELQDVPDVRDVQIAVRVVGVFPIHPLTHTDGALRDRGRRPIDAGAAGFREPGDAVRLDVALAVEVELTLDLHLDPKALAIEAVLVALVVSLHGLVTLVDVLVRTRPCAVHPHALDVRGDRTIEELEARPAGVLLPEEVEAPLALPEIEHAVVDLGQVELRADRPEPRFLCRLCHLASKKQKRRPEHLGTAHAVVPPELTPCASTRSAANGAVSGRFYSPR